MLSLSAGNWFLSPFFVLGSQSQESEDLYICFQRNLYEKLEVKVLTNGKKILFSESLCPETKELRIPINDWPRGEYKLHLNDNDRSYVYKLNQA